VDSGSRNYICNTYESFDSIKPFDKSIRVANGSSMRIIRQGSITLLCKRPNGVSPFPLQLKDVYFIPKCTVNLVSTSQLSEDSIAFNLEVLCLKAFGSIETLYSITQINRHYVLNAIPSLKSAFIESMNSSYLILDPLEHSLLL
jgi:hypothetical protein